MAHKFFDEMSEQSDVKATIVSKYFYAWAGVMIPQAEKRSKRIAYIDLFAGPGRYKDGKMSTPLRILEHAINHEKMKDMLVTIFNDVDSDHSKILEKEISQCQGIGCLKHAPVVYNEEVGTNIAEKFEEMELIPTLFFIDPWGYKGLSLRLVNSVLKDWGCECIFFFNYNRINMGIRNPIVKAHMDALFGEDRAEMLRENVESLSPTERELAIVEELAEAIRDMGGKFILPFAFKNADGKRTSHYLFFISKHFLGYHIMKGVMAKESSDHHQGVPSLEYIPATERQPLLYEYHKPLDKLEGYLLEHFKGKKLTVWDIYEHHSVNTNYIPRNYKDILMQMEDKKLIKIDPPKEKRKKGTLADDKIVTFPG